MRAHRTGQHHRSLDHRYQRFSHLKRPCPPAAFEPSLERNHHDRPRRHDDSCLLLPAFQLSISFRGTASTGIPL